MRKTETLLSDGRELIYYDRDDRPPRTARDERDLSPIEHVSELRYDRLLQAWSTIASHRQDRVYLPSADACPLCPTRPGHTSTEVPEPDYDVVVFENRFPSFAGVGPLPPDHPLGSSTAHPGVGRCEVICFTPEHEASFADLTSSQAELVLAAWIDRTAVLMEHPEVAQVYCFENRGEEIGVTEHHPHGQIYAYPFVTPRTTRALEASRRFALETGTNLFDDMLRTELDGPRIVGSDVYWTAFVPFAARWPFEVHLYPNRRVPNLLELDERERSAFSDIYLDILRRFDLLFDEPIAYISGWHQAPAGEEEFALHLELFTIQRDRDKMKYLAGSESGMDAFISDISPEMAADRLRRTR